MASGLLGLEVSQSAPTGPVRARQHCVARPLSLGSEATGSRVPARSKDREPGRQRGGQDGNRTTARWRGRRRGLRRQPADRGSGAPSRGPTGMRRVAAPATVGTGGDDRAG